MSAFVSGTCTQLIYLKVKFMLINGMENLHINLGYILSLLRSKQRGGYRTIFVG